MARVIFEGASYVLNEGESVLAALLRGGANVPYSCGKGTCHCCLMQSLDGHPGEDSQSGLRPNWVEHGMFLPCRARPAQDLTVSRPNLSGVYTQAILAERTWLSPTVCRLSFEPASNMSWLAGQFVNLRRADGLVRSYSIATLRDEDYFLSVDVKRIANGAMSNWLCDELEVGDELDVQGPFGDCTYDANDKHRNLLLLATGTGLSPLVAVAREALRRGHTGRVVLYHGARHASGLYLSESLRALCNQHENLSVARCLTSADPAPDVVRGRIVPRAFEELGSLRYRSFSGFCSDRVNSLPGLKKTFL